MEHPCTLPVYKGSNNSSTKIPLKLHKRSIKISLFRFKRPMREPLYRC